VKKEPGRETNDMLRLPGTCGNGRAKGTPNKRTTELQTEVAKSGLDPVKYLLQVMGDEKADVDRRDRAAVAVAPYVARRLSSIDATVKAKTEVTVQLTEKQRRERARQMILEAFRERTPLTVEGEYRVVDRDAVTVSGVQANGEVSEERKG
jgi:hypothetical protein